MTTRRTVDYNFAELIVAVCFMCENINSKEDIKNNINSINCINIEKYLEDIFSRNEKRINKYIRFVNNHRNKFGEIKEVYLLGKNHNSFPEINLLNSNLTQIDCKSDVMLKLENNSWIGISVKSQKDAFLTNYSIQKILSNGNDLKILKKQFLEDNGFHKFNSLERPIINSLFYPKNPNIYWEKLAESIETEKDIIIKTLKDGLCSINTPYNVYEMDGNKVINLSELYKELSTNTIELRKKEYPNKKAAKMWYEVLVGNEKKFKFEIRWKGNVFVSPQIITQRF